MSGRERLSEMSPDVRRLKALRKHHHLKVVDELRNFLCCLVGGLVLRGHPDFCRFFNNLLADGVHSAIEKSDRARSLRTRSGLIAQFGEKVIESLHGTTVPDAAQSARTASDGHSAATGARTPRMSK
jgi:hypothetical protein